MVFGAYFMRTTPPDKRLTIQANPKTVFWQCCALKILATESQAGPLVIREKEIRLDPAAPINTLQNATKDDPCQPLCSVLKELKLK